MRAHDYLADMPNNNWRDIGGQVSGRLTAVEPLGITVGKPGKQQHLWYCRCACGGNKVISVNDWIRPNGRGTKSCGCLNGRQPVHGMTDTKIHWRWSGMIARCQNPGHVRYKNYGARGIKVCERWLTFENFYADMGEPPTPDCQLDREDNDGDYEPGNVRWMTHAEHLVKSRLDRQRRKDLASAT